jgi:hypothetical protein
MAPPLKDWPKTRPPKPPKPSAEPGKPPKPSEGPLVEGYWEEWTPEDPVPDMGYCTQLYLPPGAYIVTAAAGIRLAAEAMGPSEVECSLFVGLENRSLTQLTLGPGEGESIAATAHVDSTEPTEVQWNCGGTAAPFRLQLAVTAIRVQRLHHVGTPPVF